MKTTKKIVAAILAVMMLALMIPFAASAAETTYTATLTGKAGYTVSVYKVASLDTTTGQYTSSISAVQTALNKVETASDKDVLAACDSSAMPAAVTSKTFSETDTNLVFTTSEAGVYYFKWTGTPAGVDSTIISNSVISLPYYQDGAWKSSYTGTITSKVEDSTPTVVKEIVNSDIDKSNTTASIGEDVTFTLTADTIGKKTELAKAYSIIDTMSDGLKFKEVKSVTVDATPVAVDNYTVSGTDGQVVTVALKPEYLANADSAFYTSNKVIVTYVATVDTDALLSKENALQANTNHVDLAYTNHMNVASEIQGNTVNVYSFSIPVLKVDGNTNAAINDAAKFTLYSDADCKTVAPNGAEAATVNGVVTFNGLKAGTYYLKETAAPKNYNINSAVFTVTISTSGAVTGTDVNGDGQVVVKDYPLSVPQTGGAGTIMFYIGGAALIACAGVLLLALKSKKNA